MNNMKKWDLLSNEFDTYKDELFYGAADNIYTAWPVFLGYIRKNFWKHSNNLRALDYGCGTGMFCKKLKSFGFEAYGVDISPKMIDIAKGNLKGVKFYAGSFSDVARIARKAGKFDFISSIMALQFIRDIEKCMQKLSESLNDKGHFIFAVHNPVKLDERKIKNEIDLWGQKLPIFRRNSGFYDNIFENSGFVKTLEKYPKTSKKFLRSYKQKDSLKIPKYMILAYRKK